MNFLKTAQKPVKTEDVEFALETNNYFKFQDLLKYLPFLIVAIFPLFWQLGSIAVRQWDEARLAVNAAEMINNGNLLVTYFDSEPDMWNTKPPLQIWLIALSIKVFGYTEFAVRFPAVLAVIATFVLLLWFSRKVFNSDWAGILSIFVLVTSQGYSGYHVARNGDYDALLVFFSMAYLLSFFVYLEELKPKYLLACGIAISLAVLTKGVAGLMAAPVMLLYVLYRRKLVYLIKQPVLYKAAAIVIALPAAYYLLREWQNPGYLQAVYDNELGGRYLETLEGHLHPWDWYLQDMDKYKFLPWLYVFPVSIAILFLQPSTLIKRFAAYGTAFLVIFMFVISSANTKLQWYDAPLYPMAALLIGVSIWLVSNVIIRYYNFKYQYIFYAAAMILIFWKPYHMLLKYHLQEKTHAPSWHWETFFGPALKDLSKNHPEEKNVTILARSDKYNASLRFYMLGYKKEGYLFTNVSEQNIMELRPNELVVTCNSQLRDDVETHYEVERLYSEHTCRTFRIISKK
ncbi:MAG: glycosyltransferase family 39 protein [Hymenobacteraceae bacterium]|nr:glycosyltransferase family 39 protein [Hymenobacteraceae bacterium]MDX5395635.1 glycosyltransferase family 39 protein [Hymenobacteraceae bacterium]MDX5511689.1 glycosyltransferase family 39 protein [Hymenobacteraceae bacterium]